VEAEEESNEKEEGKEEDENVDEEQVLGAVGFLFSFPILVLVRWENRDGNLLTNSEVEKSREAKWR